MFIVALFTIAKTWNQPKCPSMIDWTGKMWHIYTMEYYAAIIKDEFMSFAGTWMKLGTDTRTENQTLHVLTHRRVLNNENTWTQGEEHHSLEIVGGSGLGRDSMMGSMGRDNMGRNAKYR